MSSERKNLLQKVFYRICSGSTRTVLAKKNAIAGVVLRLCAMCVSVLMVRVTLNYLDKYQYGIWLTLSALLVWFNFLDIGLGHGLRNKLGEMLARNDLHAMRGYVSTAFVIFGLAAICLGGLAGIFSYFISWSAILNIPANFVPHLNLYVFIVICLFLFDFFLKHFGVIYTAYMQPAIPQGCALFSNFLALLVIFFITYFKGNGNFVEVALICTALPVSVDILMYLYTFYVKYPHAAPAIRFFHKDYLKDLLKIGVQFFILQIAVVILFISTNFLISHLFNPAEVTPYNIAYRYFSIVFMLFGAAIAPLWSAVTNAYTMRDFQWIKNTIKKLQYFWCGTVVLLIVMLFFSSIAYRLWLGRELNIPFRLSLMIAVFFMLQIWNSIYTSFINGTGKIKIQMITAVINMVCYPVMGIFCAKIFGVIGLVLIQAILSLIANFVLTYQTSKILNGTASGVWNQ